MFIFFVSFTVAVEMIMMPFWLWISKPLLQVQLRCHHLKAHSRYVSLTQYRYITYEYGSYNWLSFKMGGGKRRPRTTSSSGTAAEGPVMRNGTRTIYTAGRPPWYDSHGQLKEAFVIGTIVKCVCHDHYSDFFFKDWVEAVLLVKQLFQNA
jgi:hypothetical protein